MSRHVSLFRRESYGRTLGVAEWEFDGRINPRRRIGRSSIMNSPANQTNEPLPNQFFPTDLFPNQLNPPITVYFARARDGGTFRRDSLGGSLRLRDAATARRLDLSEKEQLRSARAIVRGRRAVVRSRGDERVHRARALHFSRARRATDASHPRPGRRLPRPFSPPQRAPL